MDTLKQRCYRRLSVHNAEEKWIETLRATSHEDPVGDNGVLNIPS